MLNSQSCTFRDRAQSAEAILRLATIRTPNEPVESIHSQVFYILFQLDAWCRSYREWFAATTKTAKTRQSQLLLRIPEVWLFLDVSNRGSSICEEEVAFNIYDRQGPVARQHGHVDRGHLTAWRYPPLLLLSHSVGV